MLSAERKGYLWIEEIPINKKKKKKRTKKREMSEFIMEQSHFFAI